jgi:putative CocE/NonD family hydrolase
MNARIKKLFGRWVLIPLAAVLLLLVLYFVYQRQLGQEKTSEFGKYQGYTVQAYDGTQRTSDYLALADGTRLAYDLYLPTKSGVLASEPLPALFEYTPYSRAWTVYDEKGNNNLARLMSLPWYYDPMLRLKARFSPNGKAVLDTLFRTEWLADLVKSGYAVIVVERPGSGASFGRLNLAPAAGASESNEILNWIAAQVWCNGNIGMVGDSIAAQIQFLAASSGNPHLKAILPATTWMDNYSAAIFPGGIRDKAFVDFYVRANLAFDSLSTPVDQDKDGSLLAQAREERRGASLADIANSIPAISFRDVKSSAGGNHWEQNQSLYPLLDRINRSGIPVYLIDGWYDIYARDDFLIYANLTVPKRLMVRPLDHSGIQSVGSDIDYGAEAHRWFDYWLKGIDNGIMDEPPIHFFVQGAPKAAAWQSAQTWPAPDAAPTRYYFAGGITANHGQLLPSAPAGAQASDSYAVDYTTTSGKQPRWSAPAEAHKYPNMRSNDARAVTYTTPPLATAVNVAGHPMVHIWLSTAASDLDVFAYLEQVDQSGNSTYVTEGELRASHRALGQAPYNNLGLPFHTYYQSDQRPIPAGEPVELVFDLLPTAWQFAPGSAIRLAITFADAGNFETPILDPVPTVNLLRDISHPAYVEIPTIQVS